MNSEKGMLHHSFDELDGGDFDFCWSEAYKNDAALFAHLANPVVGAYLEDHGKLADKFVVEIYGTIGAPLKKACDEDMRKRLETRHEFMLLIKH